MGISIRAAELPQEGRGAVAVDMAGLTIGLRGMFANIGSAHHPQRGARAWWPASRARRSQRHHHPRGDVDRRPARAWSASASVSRSRSSAAADLRRRRQCRGRLRGHRGEALHPQPEDRRGHLRRADGVLRSLPSVGVGLAFSGAEPGLHAGALRPLGQQSVMNGHGAGPDDRRRITITTTRCKHRRDERIGRGPSSIRSRTAVGRSPSTSVTS
jgi:hypothetical protein